MIDLGVLDLLAAEIGSVTKKGLLVVWSDIIDQSGTVNITNGVTITLVKVEKEVFVNRSTTAYRDRLNTNHQDAGYDKMPLLDINFYIQFASYSNAKDGTAYKQMLRQLGYVLSYFQANPVLTSQNVSKANASIFKNAGIDKLIFEMINYSHQELSNLWSQLGAKYVPSVVYKMRMITIDAYNAATLVPPITSIDGTVAPVTQQ